MAQEVILRLEEAQDNRELTTAESQLRSKLTKRLLGWAVIEKARRKQCARINYLKEGDANTRFFHLRANARRRKNFIQRLRRGNGWAPAHEDKSRIVQDYFQTMMTRPPTRVETFDWDSLQLPRVDLSSLDEPIIEDEIKKVISQIPQDKAPGPEGFTGHFYNKCWQIIKSDVIAAINSIYNQRCRDFDLLNKANIVLIPKKEGAESVTDFRPISLIHGVAKIVSKILSL